MSNSKEDNDGDLNSEVTTILQASRSSNAFDKLTKFIDENIRAFRYMPWLIGGAGVLLLIGSANMFRRYKGTNGIPYKMIHNNSSLRASVVKCDRNSLYVKHTPLLRRLTRIGVNAPADVNIDELIKIQFSGVSIETDHATSWLIKMKGNPVQLRLLYKNEQSIECIVHSWRSRWLHYVPRKKYCINEELILLGMGRMVEPRGFIDRVAYVKFLQQLARQERIAQLKGRGIWHGTDHTSSWNKMNQWVNSKIGRSA